mgnify:CR=1 FL=1
MALHISLKPKINDNEFILFPEAEHLKPFVPAQEIDHSWLHESEGKLAVDVYETEKEVIVRSAIAGVNHGDLEVFAHNDMLTIRGKRLDEHSEHHGRYLVQECHLGSFSRSLILPADINTNGINAALKDGVLTIHLPKVTRSKRIPVRGM